MPPTDPNGGATCEQERHNATSSLLHKIPLAERQAFLFDPPRRALVPMSHRVSGPRSTLIGMARSARIRNLVLVRHHGGDELESMRVNKGAGRAFRFDCRHVAGDTLAARTSILVVRVLFDSGCPWTIR